MMSQPKILGIDTSTRVLALALAEGAAVQWEMNYTYQFLHGEQLFVFLAEGLQTLNWTMDDITVIACGIGPGSFTGLRVGLAAVKGFGMSGKQKIVGISSLDIIAENCPRSQDCAVIVDAKREKFYTAFYTMRNRSAKKKGSDHLMDYSELIAHLHKHKAPLILCGDGLRAYGERLRDDVRRDSLFLAERDWYPRGSAIISCAMRRIRTKEFIPALDLVPEYIRPSLAEEVLKTRIHTDA